MAKAKSDAPAVRNVTVAPHALDQYEVLVEGRRVAYVCVGEHKPINFLPASTINNLKLTVEEKIAIAEKVRELMAEITTTASDAEARLARLVSGEPLP